MWVGEVEEVGPVGVVEAREGGEEEDFFAVGDGVCGCGEVVEVVVGYGGGGGGGERVGGVGGG